MRRRALRLLFTAVLGTLGGILGTLAALALSPPGRELLARNVSAVLTGAFRGQVSVGAVGGTLLDGVALHDVEIHDDEGRHFATVPLILADYQLGNLLAGRIVLSRVTLVQPVVTIEKYREGRTNFHRIFRLGEGEGDGGPPPLVLFRSVRVVEGHLTLLVPWNPPEGITAPEAVADAVREERQRPGRRIVPGVDGLVRVIAFDRIGGRLPRVSISSPAREPISLEIDSLSVAVSDPTVQLLDAAGRVSIPGDTLRFELTRAVLPGSEFAGQGMVFWPEGETRYAFEASAPRLDLDDLLWISDALPSLRGSGAVEAASPALGHNEFALTDLALEDGRGSVVTGRLTLVLAPDAPLGFRDLRLQFLRTDVEHFRGFLDTMPLAGTLTGPLTASGRLDALRIGVDWQFADARLPGRPVTQLAGQGGVALGGNDGLRFQPFSLERSDIWLPTVREVAPTVLLEGRVAAVGTLTGPWKRATFDGRATHRDGERPPSGLHGQVTLDITGAESRVTADLVLDSLRFEGIRRGYPGLPVLGGVRGRMRLDGTMDRMQVDGQVEGELGELELHGPFTLSYPDRWGGDSALLRFRRLDLAVLRGTGPSTSLQGQLLVDGRAGPPGATPAGELQLALGPGRVRTLEFDSVIAGARVRAGVLEVDTLHVSWPRGFLAGAGQVGWDTPAPGSLVLELEAETLRPFDNLLHDLAGVQPDSLSAARPLVGSVHAGLTLSGALDSLTAEGTASLLDYGWRDQAVTAADATLTWSGRRDAGTGRVTVLAPDILVGSDSYSGVDLELTGRPDSLGFRAAGALGVASRVSLVGAWQGASTDSFDLRLDSATTEASGHVWQLLEPLRFGRRGGAFQLSPVQFAATDGAGFIRTTGNPPSAVPGDMTLEMTGVPLADLLALAQADTAGRQGLLGAELQLGGTRDAPLVTGSVALSDLILGEFRAPYLQGVLSYQESRLFANLLLWKTGTRVLEVNASLPLDMSLRSVPTRRLGGPLEVRAVADSVNLGIFEAFTASVRDVSGLLTADVAVEGSWQAPRLDGGLEVSHGAARVPGLGVRFSSMHGRASFAGDSMTVDTLSVAGERGTLAVGGSVRFANLTRPILDLRLHPRDFRAIDVRNYLTLDATGDLELRGPVFGATVTGRMVAEGGQLYFADLIQKDIINLEDPLAADLIDTTLIRQQGLGAAFQSRFLDSLTIRDVRFEVGEDFWLRSSEANIQVDGSVRANKTGRIYRFDGTFNARRGTYVLNLGFVTRDFTVRRGTVRFFGTEDLNADLDIEADHLVKPVEGGADITVTARITGTMLVPELTLTSDVNPPLSETDLVSYLMFGRPTTNLTSGGGLSSGVVALDAATSVISSEIERALISDLSFPVDYIQLRPGFGTTQTGSSNSWQLVAGWQVGRKVFMTVNAGFCTLSTLSSGSVGAGLEYRFNTNWRSQLAVEPVLACYDGRQVDPLSNAGRYQIGVDVFWEREY